MELILMQLTDTKRQGVALAAREELARRSYAYYFLLANSDINAKMYNYTKYICDRLQEIIDGKQKHLILELPPQHGKSMTVTETFPSYYLMKNPEKAVMVTSYAEDMYTRFAKKNRMHYMDWSKRLFGLLIGKNTSNEFDVAGHEGEAYFTSIYGGGTGRRADLLIIDDPIKDAKEAKSQTVKDSIWDEWTSTFSTRLQHNASVIVIMTRWQVDDLAGRLIRQDKTSTKHRFNWEVIKFPAIADLPAGVTDAIGRHNGEALNPEKHPIDDLLRQRANIGTHKFEAMYQQSPTIEGGNIFKREWVKYYVPDRETMLRLGLTEKDVKIRPRLKHMEETVQAWDATFKGGANDDFVAGQTWARYKTDMYLLPHWCHKRLGFTETLDAIRAMSKIYPQATVKLVEDKANGPAIIDTLKQEISGIMPVSPGADSKESRASSVTPYWEAGQVYIPHPLWISEVDDWLEEILNFPNGAHDDNVDSMVYGVRRLQKKQTSVIDRFLF